MQCQDRLEVEHVLWEGKYKQKVFCEELVWIDIPSSIPIPIQGDGARGVLETQLLPMLGLGQEGWTPHPGHPESNRLGAEGTFLGHLDF